MSKPFTYDKLSLEGIKEAIEKLNIEPPKKRTMVIHTGPRGREIINREIERYIWLDRIDEMVNEDKLTSQERDNLEQMIKSPDQENFVLAQEIIKVKNGNFES